MWLVRLIRLPNLLVIALTQWLIAKQVLGVAYAKANVIPALNTLELWVLILATAAISAAGYVVNDIADVEIDRVNRPDRLVIGKRINIVLAQRLASGFALLSFGCSLWLAWRKDELEWLWLYPVFGGLLLAYPRWLKTRPFLGNLWVSICCAGVLGLVWLAERAAWAQLSVHYILSTYIVLVSFLTFAFLVTWVREVVKDLEDRKGDERVGRQTLPIAYGNRFAKGFVLLLTAVLVGLLLILRWTGLGNREPILLDTWSFSLVALAVILSVFLVKSTTNVAYHRISTAWKFYMLGGLFLLFCFKFFL
ncbi:MAG: geranylgeranylglycerol-phosphate geranylgeranyltransferase [Bacteroidota bacterium]